MVVDVFGVRSGMSFHAVGNSEKDWELNVNTPL